MRRRNSPLLAVIALSVIASAARAASIPVGASGVQIVAPADPLNVAKYGKLELLVSLTTSATNNFNPDASSGGVDLNATFTAPNLATTKVNGFFDGTNWRVRFAPTQTGNWTFTVSATDGGGSANWNGGSFTCVASSSPGFAKIDGTYLRFSEGQASIAIGHNNGWQDDVEQPSFSSMTAQGENLLSFWINEPWKTPTDVPSRCPIENIAQGVGVYNQTACAYLDGVVARAESAGVYLLPSIWSHGNLRYWNAAGGDPQNHPWGMGWWSNNAYSAICSATDFFNTGGGTDTTQWKYQKNYYRYLIARYGYSRAIVAWVGVVEINGTTGYGENGQPSGYAKPTQAQAWCAALSAYFAANDPFRVNTAGKYPLGISQTDYYNTETTWPSGCDLSAADSYTQQYDPVAVATAITNEIGGGGGVTAMRASGRPSFIAEFGANSKTFTQYQPTHLHNGIWAGTAAGSCISPLLWCDEGYFPMLTDATVGAQLRAQLQHLSEFTSSISYIDAPGFAQSTVSVTGGGFNARGMQLTDRGFGWIQNTAGNVGGQTLTVSGLTPGKYNLFWYDTWVSGANALSAQPQIVTVTGTGVLSATVPTPGTARADLAYKFTLNSAPTIAVVAAANPNPATGTTTMLSVLGADDLGESNLVYHWAVVGTPPAAPVIAANDTNAAKSTGVTFTKAGSYGFQVTITDADLATITSSTVVVSVPQTPTTINVTPASTTVALNHSTPFAAQVFDQFGQAMAATVGYSVSGGGTIDAAGNFTAGAIEGGPFTITASAGTASGTATVGVINTAPVISAATAMPATTTTTSTALSVTASDDGGEAGLSYTWSVLGAPPGGSVTFTPNGTNAAKNAVAQFNKLGTYTLSVSATDSGTLSASANVTVTVQQALTTIDVAPTAPVIGSNGTQQFTATPRDQYGSAMVASVVWSASGGGSINASGLLTAQTASGGPFTVSATSGAVVGSTTFTVTNAAPVFGAVTATPSTVTSTTTSLQATASDDGGEAALTYAWSATTVPPGGAASFSASGSNAAKNSIATFTAPGNYVLTVTATDGAGLANSSSVSVTVAQTPALITVAPGSVVLEPNATQQYSATVTDQFGSVFTPALTWSVDAGGSIDASGLFTAGAAQGGPFTVTAAAGGASGTAVVSIQHANTAPVIATAGANPATVTGTTSALSVSASDDGGEAGLNYTWAVTGAPSGGSASFSVNGSNAAKNTTATFTKAGAYTFSITAKDGGNLTASASVNVTVAQTATNITVTPTNVSILENATQQYAAAVGDQFGAAMSITPTWSVVGGGSINAAGLYTAGLAGVTQVKAASGAALGSTNVTVTHLNTPPVIGSVAAGANTITGTNTTLSATASDDGGEAALTYTWTVTSAPPGGGASFSANGTNAAKNTIATFTAAGAYTFGLTVKDAPGLSATGSTATNVVATVGAMIMVPTAVTLPPNGSQQFSGAAGDQFGHALSMSWSATSGSVNASGMYTAPATPGTYTVTASALGVAQNATVTVAAGTLAATVATPGTATNLTTDGSTDWTHWANTTVLSFDRKAQVAALLSNAATIGAGAVTRVTTGPKLTWTDGTPTAKSTGSKTGLLTTGVNNGFSMTVPADGSVRRLNVYVGVFKSKGRLTATLSDGSAPAYSDSSTSSATATVNRVYSFQYAAVSPGATLTIRWTMDSGNKAGGVILHAATLGSGALSGAKIAGAKK